MPTPTLARYWRDHSLSLTFAIAGIIAIALALPLPEGKAFDILSGLGLGALMIGVLNLLAGPLREKNKPEK